MPLDNETRKPTGPEPFTIYEERLVVLPGSTPDDQRTVVVRDWYTLIPNQTAIGPLSIVGGERQTRTRTDYQGQLLRQLTNQHGQVTGQRVLRFPIAALTLYEAFCRLTDQKWLESAIMAAIRDDDARMRKEAVGLAVQSGPMLNGGRHG